VGLRIRELELLAMTSKGPFGTRLTFTDGLTVVWADNTSGKSTCMMSILYALGLEGMLGPTHVSPLSGAMIDQLQWQGERIDVIASQVRLECQNFEGRYLTVQRAVTGESKQLIRAEFGPAISRPDEPRDRRDFYVRTSGAATAESGFHTYLANFIGYVLPEVPGNDQSRVPLYLECLFPFFFVDQISGWRDVKARMPTYLRIPEMAKRATEFILKLDILQRQIDRKALEQAEQRLNLQWKSVLEGQKRRFSGSGILFQGIPEHPVVIWPPQPKPNLIVTDGQCWLPINDAIANIDERLNTLLNKELPRVEQASEEISLSLRKSEDELTQTERNLSELVRTTNEERAHIQAVDERLGALREDLRKNQDTKRLIERGGISQLPTSKGKCPTCGQAIKDALLPQDRPSNPMTIDENVIFIRDQIHTFQEMREDGRRVLVANEERIHVLRQDIVSLSSLIRAQKQTLRSDADAPSAAAIREQLLLEQRRDVYVQAQEMVDAALESFEGLVKEWIDVQSGLKKIKGDGLSDADRAKLCEFNKVFLAQLKEYGFKSYPLDDISISQENYRPSLAGYELGLTSASDTIRTIWAYLLGMLELARSNETNHLGLVLFDEPKQQSAADFSFEQLLKRAAECLDSGQQVIFATSEKENRLDAMLEGVTCNYLKFHDLIIRPLPT
jgi:hypothetical protein